MIVAVLLQPGAGGAPLGRCDRAALRAGLGLRDPLGAELVAISLGDDTDRALGLALRAGCDRALAIDERADELDFVAVATALARACERQDASLVLAGERAVPTGIGAVGAAVADVLGRPHLAGIVDLVVEDDAIVATQERAAGQRQRYRCRPPLVACVRSSQAAAAGRRAAPAAIERLGLSELGLEAEALRSRAPLSASIPARPRDRAELCASGAEFLARLGADDLLGG